eukprot:SAG22_NODE_988_length_6140_cov_4.271313_5_plen_456_part_00
MTVPEFMAQLGGQLEAAGAASLLQNETLTWLISGLQCKGLSPAAFTTQVSTLVDEPKPDEQDNSGDPGNAVASSSSSVSMAARLPSSTRWRRRMRMPGPPRRSPTWSPQAGLLARPAPTTPSVGGAPPPPPLLARPGPLTARPAAARRDAGRRPATSQQLVLAASIPAGAENRGPPPAAPQQQQQRPPQHRHQHHQQQQQQQQQMSAAAAPVTAAAVAVAAAAGQPTAAAGQPIWKGHAPARQPSTPTPPPTPPPQYGAAGGAAGRGTATTPRGCARCSARPFSQGPTGCRSRSRAACSSFSLTRQLSEVSSASCAGGQLRIHCWSDCMTLFRCQNKLNLVRLGQARCHKNVRVVTNRNQLPTCTALSLVGLHNNMPVIVCMLRGQSAVHQQPAGPSSAGARVPAAAVVVPVVARHERWREPREGLRRQVPSDQRRRHAPGCHQRPVAGGQRPRA